MNDSIPSQDRNRDSAAVLAALVFPSIVTWVYFVSLAGHSPGVQQASYSIGKAIQFLFPVVWVFVVQRQRIEWQRPRGDGLLAGIGFGAIVVVAMLALYHAYLKPAGYFNGPTEAVHQKVTGFGVDNLAKYAALGLFYSLGHSFLEEYYWRWFVFRQLRPLVSLPTATTISSLGFMAHHVIVLAKFFGWLSPATWLFSISVAIGGAAWAWLYNRTNSLYGPWLSHLLVDAGIFLIGYDLVRDTIG